MDDRQTDQGRELQLANYQLATKNFWIVAALLTAALLCVPPASAQESETGAEPADALPVAASESAEEQQAAAAKKRPAIPSTPAEVVEALGPVFVFTFGTAFLAASVIALWFAIERLVVLRRGRVIPRPFVERFLKMLRQGQLDSAKALKLCEENGSPMASVFAHGIRKWGKPSVEVEQAIIDGGERQISRLRKHLRLLNGVATVTPLIGLLGTVIGMIMSFNQIADAGAMGKAQELAAGIAVALLTTAAGLLIAIPSLVCYMYFAGRVDALVMEMDHLAQNVIHLISAEALADQPVAAEHPRRSRTAQKKVG